MNDRVYIVEVRNRTNGKISYYAESEGYPSFTSNLGSAQLLSAEQVEQILTEIQRPNRENGMPNSVAHRASGVFNGMLEADIEVVIGKRIFVSDDAFPPLSLHVAIREKEAKEFKKKAVDAALAKLSPEERKVLGF